MRILLFITLLGLTSCLKPAERQNRAQIVESMAKTLDKQYPGVPSMTKATRLKHTILVDIRSDKEQNVSRIKSAISQREYEENLTKYRDKIPLAYDTLGQRSILWVSEKRAQGIEAYNLHGGILAWAHAGGEFENPNGDPTKKVHVYAEAWDMLPDGFEAITQ